MFLSNRTFLYSALGLGLFSAALIFLAAPSACAQQTRMTFVCKPPSRQVISSPTSDFGPSIKNYRSYYRSETYEVVERPFPRIRDVDQPYTYRPRIMYAPKTEWHAGLNNDEIRAKTIWSGADREDKKMQTEIVEKQLRDGPESPEAIQLAWSRAQYFLSAQKPSLAEPLLKELIVTLESHGTTNETRKILGEARAKLAKLHSVKERLDKPTRRRGNYRIAGGF